MIQNSRLTVVKQDNCEQQKKKEGSRFVLYYMTKALRTELNHGLVYACQKAEYLKIPLLVCWGMSNQDGNRRQRHFLAEGLIELEKRLIDLEIDSCWLIGGVDDSVVELSRQATWLVLDKSYLKEDRKRQQALVERCCLPITVVESNVVIPVEVASDKAEYAARTIRPKIHRQLDEYLLPMVTEDIQLPRISDWTAILEVVSRHSQMISFQPGKQMINGVNAYSSVEQLVEEQTKWMSEMDRKIQPVTVFKGGQSSGRQRLQVFLADKLINYDGRPDHDAVSQLSPYLRYGFLSPVAIGLAIRQKVDEQSSLATVANAFLEQLIVRRELAYNYVYYTTGYDQFDGMTDGWAYETMEHHLDDQRPHNYSIADYLAYRTKDSHFNIAMREMVTTGFMHNYMRMYWAKKIIEWTPTYRLAYKQIVELNNRYFLDGHDPNSYAGVAWCFGKHDHGWAERAVFGKLRYMNAKGLERKFDMDAYERRVVGGQGQQLSLEEWYD